MILQLACLFLIVNSTTAKVFTIDPDSQIIQLSHSKSSNQARKALRHSSKAKKEEKKEEKKEDEWKNVNKGLVEFINCTDAAASHIPPITIGKYKDTIKNCTKSYSVKKLQKDSEDASKKKTPRRYAAVFKCFAKIDPMEKDKEFDQDNHIPTIIQCLNNGGPKVDEQKAKKGSDSETVRFARAFERCITKSKANNNEKKVSECLSKYKKNNNEFYGTFGPGSTRSGPDDEFEQNQDIRASGERIPPRKIERIIIDKRKKKKRLKDRNNLKTDDPIDILLRNLRQIFPYNIQH